MTDMAIEDVEEALASIREVDDATAVATLHSAKRDVERLRETASGPATRERLDDLATRIDQRLAEVEERDAYDSGAESADETDDDLGAATEPEEENAP